MGKRRKENFIAAVEGVGLPVRSRPFRAMEEHFSGDVRKNFEDVLLLSRSPVDRKTYQSYRYHLVDFMESLRKMADIGFGRQRLPLHRPGRGGGRGRGQARAA